MPKETTNEFIEQTLIKRFISDTEIAEAFIYLAGANAVTGEVLVVDGGFTLK
jgi:NAD(P)-dependent dehydrogenase (short-subunit alcohol dehydrogenase family)